MSNSIEDPRDEYLARRDDFKSKYEKLFEPEINAVLDSIQPQSLTIVSAPFRFGKSTILIPKVAENLRTNNIHSLVAEPYDKRDCETTLSALPDVNQGVLLMDEATRFRVDFIDIDPKDILRTAYSKGYGVVAVFPYSIPNYKTLGKYTERWQEGELEINNVRAPEHHFQPKILSLELAREFLDLENSRLNTPYSERTLDYILKTFPRHIVTLHHVMGLTGHQISFNGKGQPDFADFLADLSAFKHTRQWWVEDIDIYVPNIKVEDLRRKFREDYELEKIRISPLVEEWMQLNG